MMGVKLIPPPHLEKKQSSKIQALLVLTNKKKINSSPTNIE